MKSMRIAFAGLFLAAAGCAVHDGHDGEPAPIWWPTPFYREQPPADTTRASIDTHGAGGTAASAQPAAYVSQPKDVRAGWNLAYDQHEITPAGAQVPASDNLTLQPRGQVAPATMYPNRGEAALGAGSPTLYPPTNTFATDPARNASVYPRGPAGSTGYIGR